MDPRSLFGCFTSDDARLLLGGLSLLEATLNALEQAPPARLAQLKVNLAELESLLSEEKPLLSVAQAATILGCSQRWVRKLGSLGQLTLIENGKRGRGNTAKLSYSSVLAYAEKTQRGKRPSAGDDAEVAG